MIVWEHFSDSQLFTVLFPSLCLRENRQLPPPPPPHQPLSVMIYCTKEPPLPRGISSEVCLGEKMAWRTVGESRKKKLTGWLCTSNLPGCPVLTSPQRATDTFTDPERRQGPARVTTRPATRGYSDDGRFYIFTIHYCLPAAGMSKKLLAEQPLLYVRGSIRSVRQAERAVNRRTNQACRATLLLLSWAGRRSGPALYSLFRPAPNMGGWTNSKGKHGEGPIPPPSSSF